MCYASGHMLGSKKGLAIGAALRWEIGAVLAALRRSCDGDVRNESAGAWHAEVAGVAVVVYRTGVGIKAARRSTRRLLRDNPVGLILNTGCAGGLADALAPGDIIVAERLLGPPPACEAVAVAPHVQQVMGRVATDESLRIHGGTVLTSRFALLTRGQKQEHALTWTAQAVEMEGAGVATAAGEAECGFASVRTIIDPMQSDLPALAQWAAGGRRASRPPLRSLLSPLQLYQCADLYRNRRLASAALERFHGSLYTALRSGMIDLDLLGLR